MAKKHTVFPKKDGRRQKENNQYFRLAQPVTRGNIYVALWIVLLALVQLFPRLFKPKFADKREKHLPLQRRDRIGF